MSIESKNPWRGLEAYREGEIIYGRDEDIRRLTQCTLNDIDTVLYGRSGIGKSSIINAGIMPAARRADFTPITIRLEHKVSAEEQASGKAVSYLKQIRSAIEEAGIQIKPQDAQSSGTCIWELFHGNTFYTLDGQRAKLLIIFDQFEEIFTLQQTSSIKRGFFAEMADMLNNVMPASLAKQETDKPTEDKSEGKIIIDNGAEINLDDIDFNLEEEVTHYIEDNEVHFIFTLREDFLPDFEYHTSAIPSLRQHRYGLRPINDEQAAEIILKPRMGLVSKDVAKLIIQKVTGRTDFELDGIPEIEVDSAVLSLYLSRLYEEKKGDTITAELVEEKGGEIISDFYESCIADISDQSVKFLEDTLVNEDGRRENKSESSISREIGARVVNRLVEVKLLRRFSYANDIRIEFIHDILCPVIKQRKEQREQLKHQEEERAAQEAEHERLLKQQRRERRKFRLTIIGAASIIVFIAACILTYYWYTYWEHVSYYATIEYVNGWPKGVGEELSKEQRAHTPLYYKLTHHGYKDHDTDIEVMSSNPKLPKSPRLSRHELCSNDADKAGMAYNEYLKSVRYVEFVEGENGKVDKEIMKDDSCNILFVISYFYLDKQNAWAQFLNANGTSMKIRDNEIDRFKISWDSIADNTWKVSSIKFYDRDGVCRPIGNNISGFLWDYPNEQTTICYQLDELGLPTQSNTYNTVATYRSADSIDVRYYKEIDTEGRPTHVADNGEGFVRCLTVGATDYLYKEGERTSHTQIITKTDDRGNVTERNATGVMPTKRPSFINYKYQDATGYLVYEEKRDERKQPYGKTENDIYLKEWDYDAQGRLTLERHTSKAKQAIYEYTASYTPSIETRTTFRLLPVRSYVQQIDSITKGRRSISFYGEQHQMINQTVNVGKEEDDTIRFHRAVYETQGYTTTIHFYVDSLRSEWRAPTKFNKNFKAISYYERIETKDSIGNLLALQIKDANGRIVRSMKYIIQDNETIGRGVMGVDGDFVRCPNWEEEGFGYYKLYFSKDFENQYVGLHTYNEFGQKSAFYLGEDYYGEVEYKTYLKNTAQIYKIGSSKPQDLVKTYKQFEIKKATDISSTEIPYLHILSKDGDLYQAGLRDNDRLVRVGTWKLGMPTQGLEKLWTSLSSKGGLCIIEVYRYDDISNKLKRMVFNINTSGNILAEFHPLRLTTQEEKIWKLFISQH